MKFGYLKQSVVIFFMTIFLTGCADSPSMLSPHGTDATRVAWLAWFMFALAAIVLTVISVLLWMAYQRSHREETEQELYAGDRNLLRNVVVGGGIVPIVVLFVVMGFGIWIEEANILPSAGTGAGDPVDIEVIGHQWWWEIHYSNQNFDTANEIHIPVGQPVTVHVTSADVVHSFWVPELHGKIDLIPGQTNTISLEADQAGVYRGQCAEFCGAQHAHMAILVIAEPAGQFSAWLDNQSRAGVEPAVGSLEQEGQQAFLGSACVYCHTIKGTNASGKVGPDLTHLGSRLTLGAGTLPNTPGNLAGWTINSQTIKPGNHMPPMDLSAVQVQALLAYLETLK